MPSQLNCPIAKLKGHIFAVGFPSAYNHFHNILRLFDVLPNLPLITSETMRNYYLQTWYNELPNDLRLRILGN